MIWQYRDIFIHRLHYGVEIGCVCGCVEGGGGY